MKAPPHDDFVREDLARRVREKPAFDILGAGVVLDVGVNYRPPPARYITETFASAPNFIEGRQGEPVSSIRVASAASGVERFAENSDWRSHPPNLDKQPDSHRDCCSNQDDAAIKDDFRNREKKVKHGKLEFTLV